MRRDGWKENFSSIWENLSEGWRHLWQSAAGALTRFRPGDKTNLPASAEIDDATFLPARGWAMVGGDVFEDDNRLVLRLEIPGMAKEDITVELREDTLVVSGEKKFEREETQGRWRILQCAYGSFRRAVPLPAEVQSDSARASYKNGVLRVELAKVRQSKPAPITIQVS
jgi:HSP20 family protein